MASVLSLIAPRLCWECGSDVSPGQPMCGNCRGALRWLGPGAALVGGVPVWAPVAYEGPARGLVRGLKYRGARRLADFMAAAICAGAPSLNGALVPVPLHPRRLRARGYNQAELLARSIARRTGMEVAGCLSRGGPGSSRQVGRDRARRLEVSDLEITMQAGAEVPDRAVLVDDVCTTGATLAACAQALRDAGVREVAAVTYARTLGR